ncbi:hypothetical protein C0991_007748 [Blastosporella zonata]|nr:hypothetical protein C0991_007748 [Blastosporella zonata]
MLIAPIEKDRACQDKNAGRQSAPEEKKRPRDDTQGVDYDREPQQADDHINDTVVDMCLNEGVWPVLSIGMALRLGRIVAGKGRPERSADCIPKAGDRPRKP